METVNSKRTTSLHRQAIYGHLPSIVPLLDLKWIMSRVGITALGFAAEHDHLEVVKLLCDTKWLRDGRGGWTAMHNAAKYGDPSCVKLLLSTKRLKDRIGRLAYDFGSQETKELIDKHNNKERTVQSIFPLTLLCL